MKLAKGDRIVLRIDGPAHDVAFVSVAQTAVTACGKSWATWRVSRASSNAERCRVCVRVVTDEVAAAPLLDASRLPISTVHDDCEDCVIRALSKDDYLTALGYVVERGGCFCTIDAPFALVAS